ncbi:unnamed protein product [Nezara viridula]|uniref:Uncharacterized protein n=1 Tax=Nezara viridula TaxID=85310 RepID=A0A9P0HE42_NEZVI|nr:unnamed protein product [Nezara viridula]
MATKNDHSDVKHVVDEKHYDYLKEKFWEFLENGYFTDIIIITDKDVNYEKKVHGIILKCFSKLSDWEKDTENGYNLKKPLLLHHTIDMIECIINLLYFGKCIVPVKALPLFMDLANSLKVSQISVYDERGSDYFVYLMHHKQKLLNYLCFIKKNYINCDMNIVSMELRFLPVHSTILAAYSKKFFHCFINRIKDTNSILLFVPMNVEKIGLILELCYFGQVTFAESASNELYEVASFIGIERFIEKCKLSRKKHTFNDEENDFRLVKPPVNSKPEIINKIKENNSHYVYVWTYNRCYIFPFLCVQLLNFLSAFDEVKENQFDIIVFVKNIPNCTIKKFISCLYNWEFKTEIRLLIDLFGLNWPTPQKDIPSSESDITVNNDLPHNTTTMYASNLDDLRLICEKVFKEECNKGEKIIQLFTCQTCEEQFLSWRAYRFHCKEHRRQGYLCEECGRFVRPNIFLDHSARHKASQNNECKHCFKQFSNAYRLKQHQSSCILEKCPKCNKRVQKLTMNDHIAKHTMGFQCPYCKQNFTSSQWLKTHLIKQKFLKPVKCVYCQRIFIHKCHLKDHIDREHLPVACTFCPETFKSEGKRNKHFMIKHSKKQIRCSVCNKLFSNFSSLKVHERFHSGEKPFKCKICYKKFSRYDTMHYHIQQTHEKRKYICPICKKDYSSKSYFTEHCSTNHQKSIDPDLCLVKCDNIPIVFHEEPVNAIKQCNEKINLENDKDYRTWLANKKITHNCTICRAEYTNFIDLMLHLDTHLSGQ